MAPYRLQDQSKKDKSSGDAYSLYKISPSTCDTDYSASTLRAILKHHKITNYGKSRKEYCDKIREYLRVNPNADRSVKPIVVETQKELHNEKLQLAAALKENEKLRQDFAALKARIPGHVAAPDVTAWNAFKLEVEEGKKQLVENNRVQQELRTQIQEAKSVIAELTNQKKQVDTQLHQLSTAIQEVHDASRESKAGFEAKEAEMRDQIAMLKTQVKEQTDAQAKSYEREMALLRLVESLKNSPDAQARVIAHVAALDEKGATIDEKIAADAALVKQALGADVLPLVEADESKYEDEDTEDEDDEIEFKLPLKASARIQITEIIQKQEAKTPEEKIEDAKLENAFVARFNQVMTNERIQRLIGSAKEKAKNAARAIYDADIAGKSITAAGKFYQRFLKINPNANELDLLRLAHEASAKRLETSLGDVQKKIDAHEEKKSRLRTVKPLRDEVLKQQLKLQKDMAQLEEDYASAVTVSKAPEAVKLLIKATLTLALGTLAILQFIEFFLKGLFGAAKTSWDFVTGTFGSLAVRNFIGSNPWAGFFGAQLLLDSYKEEVKEMARDMLGANSTAAAVVQGSIDIVTSRPAIYTGGALTGIGFAGYLHNHFIANPSGPFAYAFLTVANQGKVLAGEAWGLAGHMVALTTAGAGSTIAGMISISTPAILIPLMGAALLTAGAAQLNVNHQLMIENAQAEEIALGGPIHGPNVAPPLPSIPIQFGYHLLA